jgi:allantoicase
MDFTCVETQIGNGNEADCEIINLDGLGEVFKVKVSTISLLAAA